MDVWVRVAQPRQWKGCLAGGGTPQPSGPGNPETQKEDSQKGKPATQQLVAALGIKGGGTVTPGGNREEGTRETHPQTAPPKAAG